MSNHFSDYLHPSFRKFLISHEIDVIFEIGSKNGRDAVLLSKVLGAKVYAFECNPEALNFCFLRLAKQPQVQLIAKAAWNTDGYRSFYPVIATIRDGKNIRPNMGASSCFRARSDYLEQNTQIEIMVETIRLDTYCRQQGIHRIDLICMDVQGAALQVLEGTGDMLATVKYIVVELERRPLYYDQGLFPEIDRFLQAQEFRCVAEVYRDAWFSDYLYIAHTWSGTQSFNQAHT